jgi:hypothetical protein
LIASGPERSCTIGANQTLFVVFNDPKTRKGFESTLAGLPCPIVLGTLGRFTPTTSAGSTRAPTALKLPLIEVGTRGIVASTGTAPNTDQIDLAAAASTDTTIAAKTKGKARTFSYTCTR